MLWFHSKEALAEHAENAERSRKMCAVRRRAHNTLLRSALSACSARGSSHNADAKPSLEPLEDRLMLNAGDLDVVFAGGKATANFSLGAAQAQAIAVQADSKIVAVGQAGGSSSAFALARFNLNGTLDPSFGTGGEVTTKLGPSQNGAATGVVIQPDGKILVAGSAGPGGSQEFAVARYNAN